MSAAVPRLTNTLVRVSSVDAGAAVEARVCRALVDVFLAVVPGEPWLTLAGVREVAAGLGLRYAGTAIDTRVQVAVCRVTVRYLAILAAPRERARAGVTEETGRAVVRVFSAGGRVAVAGGNEGNLARVANVALRAVTQILPVYVVAEASV